MAATGLEVTAAEEKIATAKAELDRARGALANIDVEVAAFVGSQNPRERWQALRSSYTTAKESIMAAHKATVEAVLLLKTASTPAPTVTGTTTAEDVVQ
jgi:hypothetical protein